MPTISSFYGIMIRMFWRDHNPPHFHAVYGGDEVLIDVETLDILEGLLPRRALQMVLEWARFQDELSEGWELCRRNQRPKTIAPLR